MANFPLSPDESITSPKESLPGVPDFGWRVNLDYECKTKCTPFFKPRLSMIPELMGLIFRYMKVWFKTRREGRRLFIDHLDQVSHKSIYGCPIGGIGCGTIGRGYRGEFCRFQILPGMYDHHTVTADQFIVCVRKNGQTVYQKVLTGKPGKHLKSWQWGFPLKNGTYHALYPRAWTVYNIPELDLRLTCKQISPVIPNDYKDSSFPMAAFIWNVENNGTEPLDVSIVFTFKNGRGVKEDAGALCENSVFTCDKEGCEVSGLTIKQRLRDMTCVYGVATKVKEGFNVSHKVHFDPKGSGKDLWNDLAEDGQLNSDPEEELAENKHNIWVSVYLLFLQLLTTIWQAAFCLVIPPHTSERPTHQGKETAVAVCSQTTVRPGASKDMEFTLVWDMPLVHFRDVNKLYGRRYGRWFGYESESAPRMCSYALKNYSTWEQKIEQWQNPVLQNSNLPAWYKSALFNELYYVSDGGSVWVDPVERVDGKIVLLRNNPAPQLVQEYSKFAYLEGHEYRMFNTYDVHFYASFALITLWPKLQLSLQYDMATAVLTEDTTPIVFCMEGKSGMIKVANAVPHDVGDPEDDPWNKLNAYIIHPTDDWKDLNTKFVLQTYRDYSKTKDKDYLETMYPVCKNAIELALAWDTDGDGIIDNGGYADQTFDAWTMTGASAYCGGLWLASLRMLIEMGTLLNKEEDVKKYSEILKRGSESYERKLWNGRYYNYDSNERSGHHDSLMADQLAGHWFMKASDLEDKSIFPPDHVTTTLKEIYKHNVQGFGRGNMGAINGVRPDGSMDISSVQSEEFWVGVTYGLAANMIQEGMLEEAFQTAWGAYHVCWEWFGLAFQTPEAYMEDFHYRSLGYMRPLCIWSMQWALEKFHPHLFKR